MDCREFHGQAGAAHQSFDALALWWTGVAADRGQRIVIPLEIAFCIRCGLCRFSEHVVREAIAFRLELGGAFQRLADISAKDELVAHHAHGLAQRLADHWFTGPAHKAVKNRGHRYFAGFVLDAHNSAGQHQTPGRRVHEQRRRVSQMRVPLAAADLLGDQLVCRFRIRHAQQGLGETHQNDAFFARQAIFSEEGIKSAVGVRVFARILNKAACQVRDTAALGVGKNRALRQPPDQSALVHQVVSCNFLTRPFRGALSLSLCCEIGYNLVHRSRPGWHGSGRILESLRTLTEFAPFRYGRGGRHVQSPRAIN